MVQIALEGPRPRPIFQYFSENQHGEPFGWQSSILPSLTILVVARAIHFWDGFIWGIFRIQNMFRSFRSFRGDVCVPTPLPFPVLQLYLTSHKPVLRFAAVRLLNKVCRHNASGSVCLHVVVVAVVVVIVLVVWVHLLSLTLVGGNNATTGRHYLQY